MKTNEKLVAHIKQILSDELLKRGFTAPITVLEERVNHRGEVSLIMETESFNTVPVLFRTIKVASFSSSINETPYLRDGEDVLSIWMQINVFWKHFDIGQNESNLFTFKAEFVSGDERVSVISFS